VIVGKIDFANPVNGIGAHRFNLLRETGEKLHPHFAAVERHAVSDSRYHGKMEIPADGPLQNHATRVNQGHVTALAQKRDGSPLRNFNGEPVRQYAPHSCALDPRECLDLASPLV
jgi:hypothetical protein